MNGNKSKEVSEKIRIIMGYEDDEFISHSYIFLLNRRVDIGGLKNYRKILYRYRSKAKVLLDILSSNEGKSNIHWSETVAVVRQARRQEWLKKLGILGVWAAIRRVSADDHEGASTHTFQSSYDEIRVLEFGSRTHSSGIRSKNKRDLSKFDGLYSPRSVMIANILASTERG